MQPRPLEDWIEKGHQRDANLCGACERPTDEVWFLVVGLLCRHTASNSITTEMHTSGAQ